MEKIISLAKRRGFIFPSSEIYGGFSSSYDYGPLGVELKNNIKQLWWKAMVQEHQNIVGLDSAILMHPKIWEASGHVENFTDPMVDCKKCRRRFRADHLAEEGKTTCPECGGELTEARTFNLLMKTHLGPVEDEASMAYLRGETCQGIYVNFLNVLQSTRQKLPFGIAQIGKSFRNEITPRNFIFRMREFEQMEMQYFVREEDAPPVFERWKEERMKWYLDLGLNPDHLHFREHRKDELAHYARKAIDIEYDFPFGTKELEGIHNRGDWDLKRHGEFSGKDLSVPDLATGKNFIPHIVETSGGPDRVFLALLCDAYEEIEGGRTTTTESNKEMEVVLRLHPRLAPFKVAVLPLSKKELLQTQARSIVETLQAHWMVAYDEVASIGRRYRRQDEIGTPFCVTVDFETLNDHRVTVRHRDTMKQDRIAIADLQPYLNEQLNAA